MAFFLSRKCKKISRHSLFWVFPNLHFHFVSLTKAAYETLRQGYNNCSHSRMNDKANRQRSRWPTKSKHCFVAEGMQLLKIIIGGSLVNGNTKGLVLHIFSCNKCSINCLKIRNCHHYLKKVYIYGIAVAANHTQSFGVILETPPQTQSSKLDRTRLLESVHRG